MLKSVCVYCGSRAGDRSAYVEMAREFGEVLARSGIRLVYGGGRVGLMGAVADAVLESGGKVTGVIPEFLAVKELLHTGVDDMVVVDDMHARKALMAQRSDAFVALPGGFGTFEELFETITWSQLGIHAKPIGILNVDGYFDHLLSFLERSFDDGFIKPVYRDLYHVHTDGEALLEAIATHRPPDIGQRLPQDKA